jgi:hypothetical protein
MKNITKTLLVLVSSLSISFAAIAGEVSLTGSAKASYTMNGTDDSNGKGVGVSNELKASATGELDNGFTWSWHTELDPGAAGAVTQDDSQLVVGMGDLGTIGFFDGEGSLHSNLAWGIGALGTGSDYAGTMTISYGNDVDGEANIQYHTPAGLLPLGLTAKVGFQPNRGDATGGNDFKSQGGVNNETLAGNTLTQYRVDASPIDGLKIGADYAKVDGSTATAQEEESGAYYAQYAIGNFKVGYGKSLYAPGLSDKNTNATEYDTTSYGIELAVNDAISISYSEEKAEKVVTNAIAATATTNTKTKVESEITSIQAAYVIGGATLGVALTESDNADYTDQKEESVTVFSLAMAF